MIRYASDPYSCRRHITL